MDRRTIIAILLIMIVAIVPSIFFPPKKPVAPANRASGDSGQKRLADTASAPAARPPATVAPPTVGAAPRPGADSAGAEHIVTVETPLYRYSFSTRGARLVAAALKSYRSFAPNDTFPAAQLIPDSSDFLAYRVVVGLDTVSLADWNFQPSVTHLDVQGGANELEWTGRRGDATVTLRYHFAPDNYLFTVNGDLDGLARSGLVLIGMGPRIRMVEADSVSDYGAYAVVTKSRSTEKVTFRSLDPGQRRDLDGPFEWAAMKSKYFLTAILTIEDGATQLGGVTVIGGPRRGKLETNVHISASLPAPGGRFSFTVYSGPQEYRRLTAVGHDFNDVNPYGWAIFRWIIQPVSVAVMSVLLWMHEHLHLTYGLVIIVFGIVVRLALWPLNQKAMRSGMAMQAIQPEMKALQERYKKDPQKQQQEIMRLYKEHGVNPLGGCLPMLIPMPVLIAVWFVLANTIEFRGVPFLWLPDLARADPFYVIPVVSGILMFVVSKIGQMGMPPNPQAATMTYMMPVMFTFLFLNLASGVSLYYGIQNLASLPQQWLIARERLRRSPPKPAANPPPKSQAT